MTTSSQFHEDDLLAGEYVLGTLDGEAREAFEKRLDADADLAACVTAWEEMLAPLSDRVAPATPSVDLWPRIESAIERSGRAEPAGSAEIVPASVIADLRRSRGIWRGAAGVAALAAAALAALIFVPNDILPSKAEPMLLAVMHAPEQDPALLIRASMDGNASVTPVAAESPDAQHDYEIWALPPKNAAPVSLGLVPHGQAGPISIPVEARTLVHDGMSLAVSLEPSGGSPEPGPTGPVVFTGRIVSLSDASR